MKTNHSGLGPKGANPTECNNTFVSSFFRSRNDGTPEFEPSQSGGSSEAYPSSNPTHWPQTSEGPATVAVAANGRHAPTPCVTALSTSHSAPGESIPYVPTYSSALLEKSVHGRVDQAQNQPTEAATSKPYYIPSGSTVRVLNVMGTSSSASSQTLPDPSSATKPSPSVRRALAANANLLAYIVPHHPNARVVHKVSSASRLIKGHRGCMVDITFTSEYSNFLLTMATDGLVLLHAIELRDGGTLHAVILGALQLETALSCTPIGFEPCVPKNARNEAESVLRHQVLIRTTWPRMKLFALHELSVPAVEAPLVPVEECDVPYMSLGERVGEFCVTTEGNRVAIVEEGTRVAIYLLPSPARHAHWSPHKGETVDAVAFSSTNCTLVTCASQCTKIHVWNVSEVVPQCVQSLTLDLSLVQSTLPNPKYRLHINSERTFAFFVLDGCAFATMLRFSHDGNVFDAAMDLEILDSTAHSIIATSEKSTMSDDWPLNHPGTVRPLMLLLRHDDAIRTITIERYALEELARRGASSRVIGEHGKLSHVVRELSTYGSVKHTRSVSPPHGSFSPITNQRDGAQSLGRDHAAQGIMNTTAESGKSTPHTLIHNIQPIPPRAHSGAGNPRELNTASSEARSEGMKNISSGTQWSKMPQVSPPVHHRATNPLNQSDDVDTNSAPVSKGFDFSGLVAKLSQQRTGNKVDALHSETAHSTSLASHAEGEPLHEKTAVSVNPTVGNPMCTLGRVALTKNHTVVTTTTTVAAVSSSSANQNVNSTSTGMMPALASSSVNWLGRLLRQADGGSTVEASIKPSPTSSSISPSERKRDALVEKIVGTSNESSLVSMSSMTLFTNENVILSHGSDEHDQIVGSVVSDHQLDELLSASQSINAAIIDASKKVIELQRNLQELSQRRAGLGKSNATTVMTSSTQAGATNNTTDIPAACLRMISIMDHISSHLPAPLSEQKAKDTVAGHTGSAVQALHARIDDLVSTQLANYEKNWFSGVKQTFQDALHRLVMQENFVKKQLPAPEKIQHIEKMHAALDSKRITTVLAMILRVLALQTSPQARSEVKKLLYKNRYEEALNIMLEHRDAALLIEFIGCYKKAWKKFISDGAMTAFTSLALFQNLTVLIFMCPSAVPNKDPFFSDRPASILSQAGVISLMSNLAMNYFTSWEEQIHLSVYLEIRDRCIENLERFVAQSKGMNSVPKPLKLRRIFRLLGRS